MWRFRSQEAGQEVRGSEKKAGGDSLVVHPLSHLLSMNMIKDVGFLFGILEEIVKDRNLLEDHRKENTPANVSRERTSRRAEQ